jgi:hypothetical protein
MPSVSAAASPCLVFAMAGLALLSACQQRRKGAASVIEMADSSAVGQLTSGFYGSEDKRSRWTAGNFSVVLQPPPRADDRGAELQVRLFIPNAEIEQNGPIELTASVDGNPLMPETIAKGGRFIFAREIPVEALQSNLVEVKFGFDKAYVPGNGDVRELGAVITKIGLVPK